MELRRCQNEKKPRRAFYVSRLYGLQLFDDTCFLESDVGTTLVDGFDCVSRESKDKSLVEFRHENTLLVKVGVLAASCGRVELGSTNTVRVAARDK